MARSRNIKPGFYKNEDLAECSLLARLMFPGLWMLADREGRLEDRPKRIKGELFPYDNYVSTDIDTCLAELQKWNFISRYEVKDQKVIQVINFNDHQAPHGKEADSVLPDKDGFLIVHERDQKSGCVTGKYKKINDFVFLNKNITLPESVKHCASTVQARCKNTLIPDSLIPDSLIPDSLIPDSLIPDNATNVALKTLSDKSDDEWDETKNSLAEQTDSLDGSKLEIVKHTTEMDIPDAEPEAKSKHSAKKNDYPTEFESAWQAYPKRLGDNPKQKALKAWMSRLKEGHTVGEMSGGITRYAKFCAATGKVGTEAVKHMATFLGIEKAFAEEWELPLAVPIQAASLSNGSPYYLTEAQKRSENSRLAAERFLAQSSIIDGELLQ